MKTERKRLLFDLTARGTSLLLTGALLAVDAEARSRNDAADNATWRAECGSCHVAYPPALLPATEWHQLMGSLDRHFGADASVDVKAAAEIDAFLSAHAGKDASRPVAAEPRITTTRWFRRKHDEVSAVLFRSTSVKTAANCGACHPGAVAGDFNEHAVKVPRQ